MALSPVNLAMRNDPASPLRALSPANGRVSAALISGATVFALVASAAFFEEFTSSRLLVVLVGLLLLHCLLCQRVLFCREFAIYAGLFGYSCLSLCWAPDVVLGLNTLFPMLDSLLTMLLMGSLVSFYDARAVIAGALLGFLGGAVAFTYVSGFPFSVPSAFSYNAIAMMYLFGLFIALLFGWVMRWRVLPLLLVLVFLLHVAATTSIKTNFGIVVGGVAAAVVYSREFVSVARRNAFYLVLIGAGLAYGLLSNPAMMERLEYGMARLTVGLQVLQAREDVPGYSGFAERATWLQQSLDAMMKNPIFGYGVESFRWRYDITSHSTPADLVHNTGLLGFGLFYGTFAALLWRVWSFPRNGERVLCAIVMAGIASHVFISLSGTLFYNVFLAAFVAMSAGLLRRLASGNLTSPTFNHQADA